MNRVQIRIEYTASGRRKASFRLMLGDGQWSNPPSPMTVKMADRAITMGVITLGAVTDCRVEVYGRDMGGRPTF
jgi:hypothetical protein